MTKNDPRNTINDKDWRSLQDRAHGGNDTFDQKATEHRKIMNENYKNRERN